MLSPCLIYIENYDFQMSGLDIEKEHILEMACLVTDTDLNIVDCHIYIYIYQTFHLTEVRIL
jgi:oligoribonuclease (3'-5' exoribonuclease)